MNSVLVAFHDDLYEPFEIVREGDDIRVWHSSGMFSGHFHKKKFETVGQAMIYLANFVEGPFDEEEEAA